MQQSRIPLGIRYSITIHFWHWYKWHISIKIMSNFLIPFFLSFHAVSFYALLGACDCSSKINKTHSNLMGDFVVLVVAVVFRSSFCSCRLLYSFYASIYFILLSIGWTFLSVSRTHICVCVSHHNKNCWAVIEIWVDTYKWIFVI